MHIYIYRESLSFYHMYILFEMCIINKYSLQSDSDLQPNCRPLVETSASQTLRGT